MKTITRILDRLWRWYGRKRDFFNVSDKIVQHEGGLIMRTKLDGDATFIATTARPWLAPVQSITLYNVRLTDAEIEEVRRLNGAVPERFKFGR